MKAKDLIYIGFLGLTAVAIGAFGAHALKPRLELLGTLPAFETGSRYHFYHIFAFAGSALLPGIKNWVKPCFLIGILLFSGTLYLYAVTGNTLFARITPVGGLVLLLGWFGILQAGIQGLRHHDSKDSRKDA